MKKKFPILSTYFPKNLIHQIHFQQKGTTSLFLGLRTFIISILILESNR